MIALSAIFWRKFQRNGNKKNVLSFEKIAQKFFLVRWVFDKKQSTRKQSLYNISITGLVTILCLQTFSVFSKLVEMFLPLFFPSISLILLLTFNGFLVFFIRFCLLILILCGFLKNTLYVFSLIFAGSLEERVSNHVENMHLFFLQNIKLTF